MQLPGQLITMKIAFINNSDREGGASVVTLRLVEAMRAAGHDARLIVARRHTTLPYVVPAASPGAVRIPFLAERLSVYLRNGRSRRSLFLIDPATRGLTLHRHPDVQNADIICLNWINQGMLSLRGLKRLLALGKPVVWTLHDLWPAMGVCHHPGYCHTFEQGCDPCPLLPHSNMARRVFQRKRRLMESSQITFVAVSEWTRRKALDSPLLANADIHVIPNGFPITATFPDREDNPDKRRRIIMGAARIDAPIKGLDTLREASRLLATDPAYADIAPRLEIITYGDIHHPERLKEFPLPLRHLGRINGEQHLADAYRLAHIVVSASHYETFGATLVEGMAQGCIPVAFDHGGQRTIITSPDVGILVHYHRNDDIRARALADALAAAARQWTPAAARRLHKDAHCRFSAEKVADAYASLFTSLT